MKITITIECPNIPQPLYAEKIEVIRAGINSLVEAFIEDTATELDMDSSTFSSDSIINID